MFHRWRDDGLAGSDGDLGRYGDAAEAVVEARGAEAVRAQKQVRRRPDSQELLLLS